MRRRVTDHLPRVIVVAKVSTAVLDATRFEWWTTLFRLAAATVYRR